MNYEISTNASIPFTSPLSIQTDVVIARGLQKARELKSITRPDLAMYLSWTDQALEAYEQGYLPISASALYTLCSALRITVDDFYELAF